VESVKAARLSPISDVEPSPVQPESFNGPWVSFHPQFEPDRTATQQFDGGEFCSGVILLPVIVGSPPSVQCFELRATDPRGWMAREES
jgi:hypothetical protein